MADNHNTTTEELKKDSVNTAEEVHGSEDAPKKKKKIIFVSNPQNSKISGSKSKSGTQNTGNKPQQGAAKPQANAAAPAKTQAAKPQAAKPAAPQPRGPIKPLTPPSPTPSVQMVSSKPQQAPKRQAEEVVEVKETAPVRSEEHTSELQSPS